MRQTNLLTLAEGFASIPAELLADFEAQLSEREGPLDEVRPHEASCVERLVEDLRAAGADDPGLYEGFSYSFRIPQISSEFDLLKVAADAVLNVELKAENVGSERVARQLARNRYYLGPLDRPVHTFTYVLSPRVLYELREGRDLEEVPVARLVEVMGSMGTPHEGRVEDLFRASDYLVSPLNDTREFLEGRYFLTNHQEQIKAAFLRACAGNASGSTEEPPAFVVYGSAGTGKSLLLYDLARSLGASAPTCVVHCGTLSEGHEKLNASQGAFAVVSARGSERLSFDGFGAVLVDEAQRMWPSQLKSVVAAAHGGGLPLFLSLDRRQMLGQQEDGHDAEAAVRSAFPHVRTWRLSHKIRTNRGLTGFIRTLFGLRGHRQTARTTHVKVAYAPDAAHAATLVGAFRIRGYEHVRLGVGVPADLDLPGCPTTNAVVGQEFDRVVMAVGPAFSPEGACDREEAIYREHVFQGVTRARSDLALVVYDNPALLERLLRILS